MDRGASEIKNERPGERIRRSSSTSTSTPKTTSTSSSYVQIRVLAAATGVSYRISLHPNELTVTNIRRHLAAAVPPSDQILLLGPPYKVPKDSTLRSEETLSSLRLGDAEDDPSCHGGCALTTTERTGARRLFLFSKESLSESAPEPLPCTLQPQTLKLPSEPDPSPVVFPHPPSPLHQALEVYERRFMLHLCGGKAYADGADLRFSSCRSCVGEQSVMARALRAAVSNLSDHRNGAARTRSEFTSDFQAKTAGHAGLLERFERILSGLEEEVLHPSLVNIAKGSGRMMETLLDTVPVEREKAWVIQCRTAHERLMGLFAEVDTAFGSLGNVSEREGEAKLDQEAEEEVKDLSLKVEQGAMEVRRRQEERLEKLMNDHGQVVSVVMNAISGGESHSAQAAFTTLEEMSKASENILPLMESDDVRLADLMKRVADAKNRAMRRMNQRLRQVSVTQSNIQRVLSSVAVLREALTQQCENMAHLEHVAELKNAYRDFISEIRRRRAYGSAVTASCTAVMNRLAAMRADEVKARERFLRGSGRHLMPPFFEIFAPTLATPPPLFTPQLPAMVEMDTLPDIPSNDKLPSSSANTTESSFMDTHQHQASHIAMSNIKYTDPPAVTATTNQADSHQHEQQSLIVSADDTSSNELMDTSHDDRISTDAQLKTLAYENAILRQALERLGAKSPKTYIDEAKVKATSVMLSKETKKTISATLTTTAAAAAQEVFDKTSKSNETAVLQSTIQQLQKEFSSYKLDTLKLRAKLKKTKPSDKISHSSFDVGDVGLFMPTGRSSSGKKRTYLAFHSNCPHRYLSTESIEGTPDYVLGRIVFQEELVAGPLGSDGNPFKLHPGTKFWVLTVEVLKVP